MLPRGLVRIVAALAVVVIVSSCDAWLKDPREARIDLAYELAVQGIQACPDNATVDFNWAVFDAQISQAPAGAGWVITDRLYVGGLGDLARTVDGRVVKEARGEAWVLDEGDGRLLHLVSRGTFAKPAFVLTETEYVC